MTKAQLRKAIERQGYYWLINTNSDMQYQVIMIEDFSPPYFLKYLSANRAFLNRRSAKKALRELKQLLSQADKS